MENFEERHGSRVEDLKNLFNHFTSEDELRENFNSAREKLTQEVKGKPLAAVGIALAAGFLLGVILKR